MAKRLGTRAELSKESRFMSNLKPSQTLNNRKRTLQWLQQLIMLMDSSKKNKYNQQINKLPMMVMCP